MRAQRGHRSDQGKVWDEGARQQAALGTPSATSAMADTFEAYQGQMAEFRAKLQYVTGACGLAVAVGKKIVVVDLFDKPATCCKVWDRLLTGYVLDALEAEIRSRHAEADQVASDQPKPERAAVTDVEQLLAAAAAMPWQKADPVGEGDEYRANQGDAVHASALTLGDATVHLSVVVAS